MQKIQALFPKVAGYLIVAIGIIIIIGNIDVLIF
jgi:hypothetical protein